MTEEDEVVQDDDEDGDGDDDEDEDEAFPDEYFDEDAEAAPVAPGSGGRPPPFFHCVMGGYGPRGPIAAIGHLLPTTR